ncbi:MAG: hypothetical protein A2026_05615 [Deltaproteobacteria bacterium RBG_19FT_COMBO_46_12]|nr:MAG: hypothetical protein A2026_05615 [Deltaproteobacteria bacterium RBG_19FT_COMBO_46_12]
MPKNPVDGKNAVADFSRLQKEKRIRSQRSTKFCQKLRSGPNIHARKFRLKQLKKGYRTNPSYQC